MVKSIFILLFILINIQAASAKHLLTGTIESVEIGVPDETGRETLCITYVKSIKSLRTIGVVEDIYDCYYAREFKDLVGTEQDIPSAYLVKIYEELEMHLIQYKDDVQYVFSDYE